MAMSKKKKNTKEPIKKSPLKNKPQAGFREAYGFLLFMLSGALVLSLVSFSLHGTNMKNWLGMIGYAIGWGSTALFGLPAYLIAVFIGWIGWRMILKKPHDHLFVKTLQVCLGVVSLCFLLCALEDRYPAASRWARQVFYPDASIKKIYYHLGGAPWFYLYRDVPAFNLLNVLNVPGVVLFFSTTLLMSLLLLAKSSPFALFTKPLSWYHKLFPSAVIDAEGHVEAPVPVFASSNEDNEGKKQIDSDFLRYVKLRMPGASALVTGKIQSNQGEMLAIRPDQNLQARPSLSRKENHEEKIKGNVPREVNEITAHLPPDLPMKIAPDKEPSKESIAEPVKEKASSPKQRKEAAIAAQRVHNGDFSHYRLPGLHLLTNAKKTDHSSLKKDLRRKAEVLEETLSSFGIEAKVGEINCGPTITSFEVHPAIGVKVQKIKALENDIALNMEAKSIRIIAPIPGKAVVGIEVPNANPEEVGFKEMMSAYQQMERKFHIPILLGKAVNGEYVMSDLTKMPHCIIAGATGSGKSVCINTIVMSILLNASPEEIKLVMVDPKKVELTPYTKLPHMLAPVITEPQGACSALNWLVKEMERRYELLKQTGVRNIDSFNHRKIDKELEDALQQSLGREIPARLPLIVGIIDELADLMMVASSDIETPIARIAQMARAVGIHLILATQRPSREVITGLIKANFPTRISFKVSSRVNSMIVLDDTGAETLLGNGDMLFLPPGSSHLIRAQGAFIRDEDINSVIKAICDQAPPRYLIESFDRMSQQDDGLEEQDEAGDALYAEARDIVLGTGNASTTFLQRKLKIGYARAASLMDMLEVKGVVGPAEGSKARKVLAAVNALKQNRDDDLKGEDDDD